MKIEVVLNTDEYEATPIKLANALIDFIENNNGVDNKEKYIIELSRYLCVNGEMRNKERYF